MNLIKKRPNWSDEARPQKAKARQLVMNPEIGFRKRPIFMPGNLGADLLVAVNNGIVTKESVPICIEHDPVELASFKKKLPRIIPNHYHRPKIFHQRLCTVKLEDKIDFAWIDLFGNLTIQDALWVKTELVPHLTKNAYVVFTFSVTMRGNLFIQNCVRLLANEHRAYTAKRSEELPINMPLDLVNLCITQTELLSVLFSGYEFFIQHNYYHDREPGSTHGRRMMMYRLSDLRVANQATNLVWDQLDKMLCVSVPSVRSDLMSDLKSASGTVIEALVKASTAGQKAAATRRLNQYVLTRCKENPELNPVMVSAGIRARVSRVRNGN